MAVAWSRDEVLKLIEIWGDDAIQAQLEGCKRNQDVYDKFAADLRDAGFERTGKQCQDEIKKLKGEYRKVKDKRNKTGEGRFPEWDYFDSMDAILGHRPATQPPVVVNSMEDSWPGDTTVHAGDEPTADTAGDAADEPQPDERGNTSDQELDDIQPSGTGSSKDTPSSSRSGTPLAPQQRKRKRSKGDKYDMT